MYSPQSPLGSAIAGSRVDEQRSYRVPGGAMVLVTLLTVVPGGLRQAERTC
ncbi:MAG: GreA/GreB family elongation factor [Mycobacterium sp.]